MERASQDETATTVDGADDIYRLEFDVDWPPGHVAAYLIDATELVLVDAGAPGDGNENRLHQGLDRAGYTPADLDHVLITHPHTDHIGQLPAVLEGDVRLYAPRRVVEQLRRDPAELASGVREVAVEVGLAPAAVEDHVEQAVDSLERSRRLLSPDRVDVAIEFGASFSAGPHRFEAVHTPGHQINHACYVTEVDGAHSMFTGDALIEPFRAAALHVGLDHGAFDAVEAFYRAFDTLAGETVDRAYPGHGPAFDEYEAVLAASCERLDGTVEDVAETVSDVGPATPLEVTMARVEELEHPAVLLDTVGALGYLGDRDRLAWRYDEDGRRLYRPA